MRPETEAELANIISTAERPLCIKGGGTRGVVVDGETLETGALSGVSLYEPGALTLVAKSGTSVSEIDTLLASEGQRLAFEPTDNRGLLGLSGESTIGGVVAGNISGPRRVQAGACRDFMLGVRFVTGAGEIVKNGGRVMKNVTGYDLVKLMSGSFGTLGVLTEVSLKVLPKPETQAVVSVHNLSIEDAQQAMTVAATSPFDVTGAAHIPRGESERPVTMIRVEGFEASVAYRSRELTTLLGEFGTVTSETDPQIVDASWRAVRDVEAFHDKQGDVWRISCKPSDAPMLANKAGAEDLLFDWGGGLIWVLTKAGSDLRAKLGEFDGHATLIRAEAETFNNLGRFHPEPSGVAVIASALRRKFDPRGILNTGLMG
ncbi:MAG: FAD-binding protein [Paracoccaceae bacterium]|nr:FAD-binding protein [Paracoccaceae bacterium]MDG1739228.1 FAD-binding protein [Paracoccaceae bacterium]MDG2260156.1 FAD-binding protein [Paracoccaceae bacterium]